MEEYNLLSHPYTAKLVGLVRAIDHSGKINPQTYPLILEALSTMHQEPDFQRHCSNISKDALYNKLVLEKKSLIPGCYQCSSPCGRTFDLSTDYILHMDSVMREIKTSIINMICDYSHTQRQCGNALDEDDYFLLCRSIFALGEDWPIAEFDILLTEIKKVSESVI